MPEPAAPPRFAEVAVDLAVPGADRAFHYAVPSELGAVLRPGHRVRIPFGARALEGIVLALTDAPPDPASAGRIKPIAALLDADPLLTAEQLELAAWLARRTLALRAQALRCLLPPGARGERVRPLTRRVLRLADAEAAAARLEEVGPRQRQALAYLLGAAAPGGRGAPATTAPAPASAAAAPAPAAPGPARPGITRAELARLSGAGEAAVRALVEKGILVEEAVAVRRDPFAADPASAAPASPGFAALPALTPAQGEAVAAITDALEAAAAGGTGVSGAGRVPAGARARPPVFLLHGVTGSGKTEVYLRAIEAARARGRRALVLVPEIALTPQLAGIFRARFGDRVALLHSALSDGERFDEWRRIRSGEAEVAVGARSAVFAPFDRLGLIVLDEEHETSYKQEEAPRYHARDVALERGRREGAVVVLGSATPSVESYHAAARGRYRLLRLPGRIDGRPLPEMAVVDMREELERGNRSIFSARLEEAVRARLERREQVILFLNRRGFHTFVLCRECGYVVRCPRCDVSLTLHVGSAAPMRCHYCRHEQAPPAVCPSCGGRRIRYFGTGTQRVEELARERFPGARILRMDVDTTGTRGAHERIYHQFRRGEADILVGTQMIAKGWDIAGVTLVGVISADTALNFPDFRAAERTYQLLTQVAGRAGRGEVPGEVVIQTYAPDHFAIRAAAAHDGEAFYRRELRERRRLGFPPFAHLVRLVVSHPEAVAAEGAARRLAEAARALGAVPWSAFALPAADPAPASGAVLPDAPDMPAAVPAAAVVQMIGPAPAPIARLHGRHRWQLAFKGRDREELLDFLHALVPPGNPRDGDVHIAVDPDPVNLL